MTPTSSPTHFTVNRSTLIAGAARKALGDAYLYESNSKLSCVLGQYLLHLGVPQAMIKDKFYPHQDVLEVMATSAPWMVQRDPLTRRIVDTSPLANKIIAANDNEKLHPIRREAKVVKLFAQAGISCAFVGRSIDATRAAKQAMAN